MEIKETEFIDMIAENLDDKLPVIQSKQIFLFEIRGLLYLPSLSGWWQLRVVRV